MAMRRLDYVFVIWIGNNRVGISRHKPGSPHRQSPGEAQLWISDLIDISEQVAGGKRCQAESEADIYGNRAVRERRVEVKYERNGRSKATEKCRL